MTPSLQLLSRLRGLDVKLWVEGGQLRLRAPKGTLTPALHAELGERKADLIALMQHAALAQRPAGASVAPIARRARGDAIPLSFAQERLWFLDQMEASTYHLPIVAELAGRLDVAVLRRAFGELVRRHEVLRTSFALVAGRPVQKVGAAFEPELALIELEGADRDEAIRRWTRRQAAERFDLATGPLLRAAVLRFAPHDHVLLMSLHHIVADGWSIGVLIREIGTLYRGFVEGIASPLPALPIQYADFAQWQRERLQGEVLDEQVHYWRTQLAHTPAVLELPSDRPRPAAQSFRGASVHFEWQAELLARLKALGQQTGATLFMTLLAGFATLLARYSAQEDIVIGTPIANRTRTELESLIGFFVNTLVLRVDVSGDPSFTALLDRVKRMTLEAYAHQDAPFEKLVEALAPTRSLSHSPLFQVMFVLQNAPMGALQIPGLSVKALPVESESAKFDLLVLLEEGAQGVSGTIEYSTDLFDADTVRRMVGHYRTLLEAFAAQPGQPISSAPLLTAPERRQLLVEWNDTQVDYPNDRCIHELFEAQVERTPDAAALQCGDSRLTYAELNARANCLAHRLRALGVGAGSLVGICLDRSVDLVVGLLAVLKAGAAYVPLDPAYPRERVAFMLRDAGAALVLVHRQWRDLVQDSGARVLDMEAERFALQDEPAGDLERIGSARDLAYVIYTSGSTGQPKGVAIEHRSAAVLLHWARDTFSPEERAGMLACTSICFDLSVFELFLPLSWGDRVILIGNALELPALADASAVTFINTVPSAMTELVRLGVVPASVKVVGLAGEPLQGALVKSIYQTTAVERVFNLYGPSEDTTYSTFVHLDRGSDEAVTIGRPIANTRLYVLDAHRNPVPVGVPGELYIGGDGLARGYLNRDELTAERFVNDPFSEDGARLYRTGDLVRYRRDGKLEFLGRLDHQVKIRGYRIELGEIEAALLQHPGLREAVVLARDSAEGGKRLIAYVVAAEAVPHASELRRFLQERLPAYMIPAAFLMLAAMPLNPNGKIDRRALPAAEGASVASAKLYEAPKTDTEKRIAALWQSLLQVERVGVHDNFFDIGGHSLLVIQMIGRVRDRFAIEMPLRVLFEQPTLAEFSAWIERAHDGSEAGMHPLTRVSRDAPLPLSFAQQAVWLANQFEGASAAYGIPAALHIEGPLAVTVLRAAFGELIRRHEVLRTSFPLVEGNPVQQVGAVFELDLPVIELDATGAARVDAIRRSAQQQAGEGFDLAGGPLLKAALLKFGPHDHVLLMTVHHIVFDGWSIGVLVREIGALYHAFARSEPSPLPELPIQYADYAHWQRERVQEAALEAQLQYWRERLAGAPSVLELPSDRPRPAVQSFRGAVVHFELPADLPPALKALGQQAGATLFMTLLAAFATLLSRYSAQEDIVIGSPIANRTRTELESLIGFFVNTLVLRVDLSGDPSFSDLLDRVKRTTLDAYAHQDVPFETLVEALQPTRSLSHAPLFQVWFNYQNHFDLALDMPGFRLTPLALEEYSAKFDLMLTLTETRTRLTGSLTYSADLFDAYTAEQLVALFTELLRDIASKPQGNLSALAEKLQARIGRMNADKHSEFARADEALLRGLKNRQRQRLANQ
jgi:amino acid adenylation domain-containing protein